MRLLPRSLTLRLALLTGLWVALGLGVALWLLADVAIRQIEAGLDLRLGTLLDSTVAATGIEGGQPIVERSPSGGNFDRPFSGAYWQVSGAGTVLTSRSLWDQTLPASGTVGEARVALRDVPGPRGVPLRLAEREVLLPGLDAPVRVAVALSRTATDDEIAWLRRALTLLFVLLGVGLVAGVVVQVVLGLAPLRRIRRALSEVRAGARGSLAIEAPTEITPLVAEVDALIAQNAATVERARAHVGNLAHALKTPVAVLRNALDTGDLPVARAEAAALDRLVQHHLARARSAARAGGTEIAVLAAAEEIASALRRLFAGRGVAIAVDGDPAARLRADPQDLTEMLGNLMENACKWARARVSVTIAAEPAGVALTVEDDGPGLPDGAQAAALARGARLDETAPGSGLGLAIVADLAGLYGGGLDLRRSEAGGLAARLFLPRTARGIGGSADA